MIPFPVPSSTLLVPHSFHPFPVPVSLSLSQPFSLPMASSPAEMPALLAVNSGAHFARIERPLEVVGRPRTVVYVAARGEEEGDGKL